MFFTDKNIALFQAALVVLCSTGVWYYTDTVADNDEEGTIQVIDSNGVVHNFDKSPSRITLTNTYAASAMRMLGINLSIVVGVSGDFQDEKLWPEFADTPIIQNSAHSEIDFEEQKHNDYSRTDDRAHQLEKPRDHKQGGSAEHW